MENKLQANIKQIGSIAKGNTIYIEDYVMTFIKYMEERRVCDELIFLLLGRTAEIDGEEVLFISGAVEGCDTVKKGAISVFSPKGREKAMRRKEEFFPELEVAGWAYVQPGYGDFLNNSHRAYHEENFKKPYQVLYITDPIDCSQAFFRRQGDSGELLPINGYFIYYDKNEPMHEYLLEVKKQAALNEPEKENPTKSVDSFIGEKLRRRLIKPKSPFNFTLPSLPKLRLKRPTAAADPKQAAAMLGYLSFALLFVTLIIGGGLLKSNSRIEYLEREVGALGKSYIALRENVESVEKTQAVFAEANAEDAQEEAPEPETEAADEAAAEAYGETSYREYTVRSGDTLLYLSRFFYGTEDRVEDIMAANDMAEGDMLIEGKTIKIPR